ncbi:DNA (cytosine-5)-methyltransferase DRM [Salix suchowensis]|nr:DNA (cytosine-5)-methyltransferase DRM [Salix suchowensis]
MARSTSDWNDNSKNLIKPKHEKLDFDLAFESLQSSEDNVASSSRSYLRSFFTEMGYSPSLVDRVIEENGEDNVDLLLEILMECSGFQKPKSQPPDSLDCLFDDRGSSNPLKYSAVTGVKEEPDVFDEVYDDKRVSLLKMKFPVKDVEYAMDKLGENAPINEIMDFIIAAQIADNINRDTEDMPDIDVENKEDINDETLYGTMDKTLCLLDMGFSENEISLAIDKFGSDIPITELANAICAHQLGETYVIKTKTRHYFSVKRYEHKETRKGKRPRQEHIEGYQETQPRHDGLEENCAGEQPKQEYDYGSSSYFEPEQEYDYGSSSYFEPEQEYDYGSSSYFEPEWVEEKVNSDTTTFGMPKPFRSNPCKILDQIAAKPPYFFYGNVATASSDTWEKISQFLYGIEPEFVDAQFFSALRRREGYIHNLPTENRSHVLPKSPIALEDLMPSTKKWWPSWDARKKMLDDSRGLLSAEQQRDLLRHCQALNLMWVGPNKLTPMEPAHLEKALGYPLNHTLIADYPLTERMYSLRYSFQTDTLGYHLSVLKSIFPQGITVLSLFSGIGGAEITLHRLGIHLKGVVSVETSETNRRVLKRWWCSTGQTGRLEQIEDIRKLTSSAIERLFEKFGCFDLVICQNSFTQPSNIPRVGPGLESQQYFDFTLFNEFVRVLQRVRSAIERKR